MDRGLGHILSGSPYGIYVVLGIVVLLIVGYVLRKR